MNARQAENLRTLIRHMETQCVRKLNMELVMSCGTPGCAMGEAITLPALAAAGLNEESARNEMWLILYNNGDPGPIFGLKQTAASRLFGTNISNVWKRSLVTPQEWSIEARKVLAEYGHAMDDAPKADDGFLPFMAKVLTPLETVE